MFFDVYWANFWLCAVYFESVSRLPGCGEEAGTKPQEGFRASKTPTATRLAAVR